MRDLAILFVHLLATIAKLMRPGDARAVVAEPLLVKHLLVILNRGCERAPNLRPVDRVIAGVVHALHASEPPAPLCRHTEDVDPPRLPCCVGATQILTLVLAEATRQARAQGAFAEVHRGHYRDQETQSELRLSSDRQQLCFVFGLDIDKDVVRRVLASHYRPDPGAYGPSWLTILGHTKEVYGASICFGATPSTSRATGCWW